MSIPITTTTKISTPRMSILGVDTNTKSGALQYRLCEGVGDMPPVKYFEILHAQKRVLGAPETLFRACSSVGDTDAKISIFPILASLLLVSILRISISL